MPDSKMTLYFLKIGLFGLTAARHRFSRNFFQSMITDIVKIDYLKKDVILTDTGSAFIVPSDAWVTRK